MDRNEILNRVQETFREILNNDEIVLSEEMEPKDVDEWNSLAQAQIIIALEHELNIHFSLVELISIIKVEDIVNIIYSHVS